jgi:hypothetical protein
MEKRRSKQEKAKRVDYPNGAIITNWQAVFLVKPIACLR